MQNTKPIKINLYLIAAAVFFLSMIVLSSFGELERSLIWIFNDKILHFFAYFVLSILIFVGLPYHVFSRMITTFFIASGLGAVDELLQFLVPRRDPSFDDWLVDCFGSMFAVVLLGILVAIFSKGEHESHLENDDD